MIDVFHIPVGKNRFALVEREDAWLAAFNWHTHRGRQSACFYAHNLDVGYMHRLIVDPPLDLVVDHRNGDGLDNRRGNLRACTLSQNQWNQKAIRGLSQFRGVYWDKQNTKWRAKIKVHGVCYHLGLFDNAIDAAIAYDVAARENFGEYAAPNFAD